MTVIESEILDKVKSRGYWEIVIRPEKFKENKLSIEQCKEIIEKSQVRLRGWYYPHINSKRHGDYFVGDNYIESFIDWSEHCEIWRMYQSGQFVHYLGYWEDWIEHQPYGYQRKTDEGILLPNVKETIMTLYTVTEIFLFASRLASNKIFDNALHVSIQLKNTNNRKLIVDDFMRYLPDDYICKYEPIKIEKDIMIEDILANSQELSLQTTFEIFEKFNWIVKEDSKEGIKKDQEKFLKKLI